MDETEQEADTGPGGLLVQFQEPCTSTDADPTKPRSKRRKATKPVKLRRSGSDPRIEELKELSPAEEDRAEGDHYYDEDQLGNREDADSFSDMSLVKRIKWDKRMQLTIRKDFRKERRQSETDGGEARDDSAAQRTFSCTVCQQDFLHASDCLQHMDTHDNGPSALPFAPQHTDHNGHLQVQEGLETEEDFDGSVMEGGSDKPSLGVKHIALICPECGISFRDVAGLTKHAVLCHSGLKNEWECSSCHDGFSSKKALRRHKRQDHRGKECFECSVCKRFFASAKSLTQHKKTHADPRVYTCEVDGCKRKFPDVSSINRHRRSHSDERPYVCGHCGKAYKMQNHLREHERIHTGVKPFVCEVCGLGFALSHGLKLHAKRHKVAGSYRCDICHKNFTHPQFLALHKSVHSREKPFSCEVCHCTFRTACNLGAHKKHKHESGSGKGEKLFTCDVCGASYTHAYNLGVHMKKKHSDVPQPSEKNFACEFCDLNFSQPWNLGTHMKMKHAEETKRQEDGI